MLNTRTYLLSQDKSIKDQTRGPKDPNLGYLGPIKASLMLNVSFQPDEGTWDSGQVMDVVN